MSKKRATLAELLEFANKVRKAGGTNPLAALMPSVPEDSTQCLIARNLNFNCHVVPLCAADSKRYEGRWAMVLADKETRNKVSAELGLPKVNIEQDLDIYYLPEKDSLAYAVVLPVEIGQVAEEFDQVMHDVKSYSWEGDLSEERKERIREMWPYIEESVKEAYDLADVVNEKGETVI